MQQTMNQPVNYERTILAITRRLPPERGKQLLAFARFLAFETFQTTNLDFLETEAEVEETFTEADERWDALPALDEGQSVLDQLAD